MLWMRSRVDGDVSRMQISDNEGCGYKTCFLLNSINLEFSYGKETGTRGTEMLKHLQKLIMNELKGPPSTISQTTSYYNQGIPK